MALDTVGGAHTAEAVALHNAREPAAFGGSDHIDALPDAEKIRPQDLAQGILFRVINPHFL